MKFTSLTAVITTAVFMAGMISASDPANLPYDRPGKHICDLRANLKLYAYGHPPIKWDARWASKITTMVRILGIPAELTASPCYVCAKIAVTLLTIGKASFVHELLTFLDNQCLGEPVFSRCLPSLSPRRYAAP